MPYTSMGYMVLKMGCFVLTFLTPYLHTLFQLIADSRYRRFRRAAVPTATFGWP